MSRDNPLTTFWVETWFLLCNVTEEQMQEIKRKVNKMVVNNVEGLVFAIEKADRVKASCKGDVQALVDVWCFEQDSKTDRVRKSTHRAVQMKFYQVSLCCFQNKKHDV